MKTKYVCLAGVNRLVDYAMQSGASMETLSQWLNDPRDLEPIEMERYYVSICVSDALRDAFNGDLQEIQKYIDNVKEYYLGKVAEVADLTDKRFEAEDRILRLTYAVTAGGVHEIMKWKDSAKEVEK